MGNTLLDQMNVFNQLLVQEVERMVDEKLHALSKSPMTSVNNEAIIKECQQHILNKYEKKLREVEETCNSFYSYLNHDNPELYNQLKKKFSEIQEPNQLLENIDIENLKLSASEIEKINSIGLDHFNKKEWSKAYDYFSFISYFDPENPVNWVLKGMAEHNLERFDDAISSYVFATLLAPNYLFAHIYLIKSLIAMKRWDDAKHYFENLLSAVEPKTLEEDPFIKEEIVKIKEALSKK